MNKQLLKQIIREEVQNVLNEAKPQGIDLWAKGSDYNQMKRTIGDILKDGAGRDLPTWTWTSIRTLKSFKWGETGRKQVPRFEPLLKQLQQYSTETVGDFFGEKNFKKLQKLEQVFTDTAFKKLEKKDYENAFDEVYKIVTSTIKSKA